MSKQTPKTKSTRGRKPSEKTIEKRLETALLSNKPVDEPEKPKVGRPAMTYDDRPEHIRFILDCLAVGYSPTRVVNMLRERYGENAEQIVGRTTIISYQKRYFAEIQQRERELRAEIPLMMPSQRMRVLQRIIDEAIDGTIVFGRDGSQSIKKDYAAAVSAIKELNAMMKSIEDAKPLSDNEVKMQREIEEQKGIIREYIEERQAKSGRSTLEILKEVAGELADSGYDEALSQLETEYVN